jgi:hypothetical protein
MCRSRKLSSSSSQSIQYLIGRLLRILQYFRLPDPDDSPPRCSELLINFLVTPHVALYFLNPPFCTGGKQIGKARKSATFMFIAMPHITINEDGQPPGTNYQVGMPRHVTCMKPISQASCMQRPAQRKLSF